MLTASPTITSVDPDAAFLLFTVSTPGNGTSPGAIELRGRLASATTLEFVRETNEASPVATVVRWSVVEYACGVRVQRGSVAISATTTTVAFDPVAATDRTFVTWSKTALTADALWNNNDTALVELTSTSSLQIRTAVTPPGHVVEWQVVEFTEPGAASVQRGLSTAFADTSTTSADITLGTVVDPSASFSLVDATSSSDGPASAAKLVRGELVDTDTLTLRRGSAAASIEQMAWQVVSLADGSFVQRATVTLATTTGSTTLGPLDPARTTVMTGSQMGSGQGGTALDAPTGGPAPGMVALTSTATTVSLSRGSAAVAATADLVRIEWGGPATTWSTGYAVRRRLAVSATNSGGAPAGYSVAVTVDHAALVAAGLGRADGADLRIARFDGSAWTEFDRVLDTGSTWNSATTLLWFRTVDPIAAIDHPSRADDGSYWLYTGRSAPGAPPADLLDVFLFADDFESGTLGTWSAVVGGGWFTNSTDRAASGSRSLEFGSTASTWRHLRAIGPNESGLSVEARWYIASPYASDQVSMFVRDATTSVSSIVGHVTGFANLGAGHGWNIASFNGGTGSFAEQRGAGGQTVTADAWQTITLQMQPSSGTTSPNAVRVLRGGSALNPPSGWQSVTAVVGSGSIGFSAYVSPANSVYVDDVRVRRLVIPEPAAVLGAPARN